jgi:transcriptional regulator with XRE-family HTH domain
VDEVDPESDAEITAAVERTSQREDLMPDKDNDNPKSSNDESVDRQKLGARLREAREYLGLSQDEVAKYLSIPRTALSHIESGQRRIDALELKKLAQLYKRPVVYFTGESQADASMSEDVAHLARAAAGLSEGDRRELSWFAEYLRARADSEGSSMADMRGAILKGTREAGRLHRQFDMRERIEQDGGRIDVFGTIVKAAYRLCLSPSTVCSVFSSMSRCRVSWCDDKARFKCAAFYRRT